MDELKNLQMIGSQAAERFNEYAGNDFILPEIVKQQLKDINGNLMEYHKYSAVLQTKGNQKGVLNIFMPNQWFYIASYFTELYNELMKYKTYALSVTSKERLKNLDKSQLNAAEKETLQKLDLDDMSKRYLESFMTDYGWWSGAKTIDRGDFYVSPILAFARLVNASQSYIADLCAFMADKPELVKAILEGVDKYEMKDGESEQVPPSEATSRFDSRDYAYMSAIKTKPFIILGGFSGTGKSLMVKSLAFATCPCDGVLNTSETSPGNYLLVSVKPNWHDATDITGFRSSVNRNYYVTDFMRFLVKAKLHPAVPFFVCLDEMNLAPVEEYFADFLSVIESRKRKKDGTIVTDAIVPASVFADKDYDPSFDIFEKLGLEAIDCPAKVIPYSLDENVKVDKSYEHQDIVDELKCEGLTIPQNVIIIGTVNMDDTTNSFSRKVIDRAMTFETVVNKFDVSYFDEDVALGYVEHPRKGELFISDEVRATEMMEEGRFLLSEEDKEKIIGFINDINADLEGTPFKISYRILNETILLYRAKQKIAEMMEKDGWEKGVEFNTALNRVFDDILMQKVLPRIEGDYDKCHAGLDALLDSAKKHEWNQSAEKIEFMRKRFGNDKSGFTSFWN